MAKSLEDYNFEPSPEFPMSEGSIGRLQDEINSRVRLGKVNGSDGVLGARIVRRVEVELDCDETASGDSLQQLIKDGEKLILDAVRLGFRTLGLIKGVVDGR